jgi:murein tripeptide amidase MpaA
MKVFKKKALVNICFLRSLMAITVSSAFDGGNIAFIAAHSAGALNQAVLDLEIVKDAQSDFYQWFYFRVNGAAGVALTLRLLNAGKSAYPEGWRGYHARVSEDRQHWHLAQTHYQDGVLTIQHTPSTNSLWVAYFAPYSMERHYDVLSQIALKPGVVVEALGKTLDGQDIDLVSIGTAGENKENAKKIAWLIARQHPGETMAQWWMEGVLQRLVDADDPVARLLREKFIFHIVPNMNPDGARRGHLRTNAVGINLNREWHAPSLEKSPEVYHVLARMQQTGCDFNIDVHGDETIPHVFIAGFDGIPSLTTKQTALLAQYKTALLVRTPDFQTRIGYPVAKPGEANMSMSTNALAERFGCLAMTLEMPFKDANDMPDAHFGWSPERSKHLGRACLDALLDIADAL